MRKNKTKMSREALELHMAKEILRYKRVTSTDEAARTALKSGKIVLPEQVVTAYLRMRNA